MENDHKFETRIKYIDMDQVEINSWWSEGCAEGYLKSVLEFDRDIIKWTKVTEIGEV